MQVEVSQVLLTVPVLLPLSEVVVAPLDLDGEAGTKRLGAARSHQQPRGATCPQSPPPSRPRSRPSNS